MMVGSFHRNTILDQRVLHLVIEAAELEDENRRLKKMYAEERLKAELRKEALEGKW
jgi:hypothetical protein